MIVFRVVSPRPFLLGDALRRHIGLESGIVLILALNLYVSGLEHRSYQSNEKFLSSYNSSFTWLLVVWPFGADLNEADALCEGGL